MTNLELALRFLSNTGPLVSAYRDAKSQTRRFVTDARKEFESLSKAWHSTVGKIAGIGLGYGAFRIISDSAQLDKQLIRIGQTAGATKDQIAKLRKDLFLMGEQTGNAPAKIAEGFDKLIQSGAGWEQAKSMIEGINVATAVTGANAEVLANAMTTASTAFTELDLTKAQTAQMVLDKMTAAGRLGNAELENLSDIFSRVAVNAKTAGMSFDQTLSFIESLSMMEKQPERLATLADSTLRLFTNQRYLQQAQKAGFKFFDEKGARRDAFVVLEDIRKKYATLGTDRERAQFMQKLLKGADLDTVRGMRVLLSEGMLDSARKFTGKISEAGGTLKRDLSDAIDNAVDQAQRLKTVLGKVGDEISKPLNKAMAKTIDYALTDLNLTGSEMLGLGAGAFLGAWSLGKMTKGAMSRFFSGKAGLAAGVGEGKVLSEIAGVTPVYVVNFSEMNSSGVGSMSVPGMPGAFGKIPKSLGAAGLSPYVAGAVAAGFVAYGAYKTNQSYIASHLPTGRKEYENRSVDNLIDTQTGQVYRPKRMTNDADYPLIQYMNEQAKNEVKTEVNINMHSDGRVSADTKSTNGNATTKINRLAPGIF